MEKIEYNRIHKFITHHLVKAREESKLTQEQVAKFGIVSQSELSKIENGYRTIDFITLCELAKLYDKDLTYFILK